MSQQLFFKMLMLSLYITVIHSQSDEVSIVFTRTYGITPRPNTQSGSLQLELSSQRTSLATASHNNQHPQYTVTLSTLLYSSHNLISSQSSVIGSIFPSNTLAVTREDRTLFLTHIKGTILSSEITISESTSQILVPTTPVPTPSSVSIFPEVSSSPSFDFMLMMDDSGTESVVPTPTSIINSMSGIPITGDYVITTSVQTLIESSLIESTESMSTVLSSTALTNITSTPFTVHIETVMLSTQATAGDKSTEVSLPNHPLNDSN